MGIPDLMRFVARDANNALRRIPADAKASGLNFDYVLVDLTNALQTQKLPVLKALLTKQLVPQVALVLVVDGQRQRQGTSREQRQFLQQRDADASIHQLVGDLFAAFAPAAGGSASGGGMFAQARKKVRSEAKSSDDTVAPPRVIVCGREVAGEGDYKLLSIHRRLFAAHAAKQQQLSAAGGATSKLSAPPTFLFVSEDSDVLCGALCGPAPQHVTVATTLHDALHEPHLLACGPIVKRLYATSGLILAQEAFSTSAVAAAAPAVGAEHQAVSASAAAAAATVKKFDDDDDDDHTATAAAPSRSAAKSVRRAKVLPQQTDVQNAALDFIFLFALVLGSSTTPPITRGATRVDAAACWAHYSAIVSGRAKTRGGSALDRKTSLLRFATDADESPASVIVDADLLSSILESRFADDRSRVPTADERKYARDYVKHLVESTVLLAVGAPVDTRGDSGRFTKPPAVSCLTSVLERREERCYEVRYNFSLKPVSIATSMVDVEPLSRLQAYLDSQSVRSANPPLGVPFFWPPHDTRPATQVQGAKAHTANVPLPLGASPSALNTSLTVLASQYAASLATDLFAGAKHADMDSVLQSDDKSGPASKPARLGTADMTFDFDMRRMVPRAADKSQETEEAVAKRQTAQNATLAAAGLSASYFDAAAAQSARQQWDAVGMEKKKKRHAEKVELEKRKEQKARAATQAEEKDATGDSSAAGKKSTKKKRLGKKERARAAVKEAVKGMKSKPAAAGDAGGEKPSAKSGTHSE